MGLAGLGISFGGGPQLPVWFDPTLMRGARRYAGGVWTALFLPTVVGGLELAGPLGSIIGVVLLTIACTIGADRIARARMRRRAAELQPRRCGSCGTDTISLSCPSCGTTMVGAPAQASS